MDENREVSFFKNSWTNSVCLYRHALKNENSCCVCQNADRTFNVAPCGTYESELDFAPKHFNLVPSFPGFGFSCFGFLHHCRCKTTPLHEDISTLTSGVTSHYIVLHPVSSRTSLTSGLSVQFTHRHSSPYLTRF